MPCRFSVANTAFMARRLVASASSAVTAWLTTPAERIAWSGTALTSPSPETVIVRGWVEAGSAWTGRARHATAAASAKRIENKDFLIVMSDPPLDGSSLLRTQGETGAGGFR